MTTIKNSKNKNIESIENEENKINIIESEINQDINHEINLPEYDEQETVINEPKKKRGRPKKVVTTDPPKVISSDKIEELKAVLFPILTLGNNILKSKLEINEVKNETELISQITHFGAKVILKYLPVDSEYQDEIFLGVGLLSYGFAVYSAVELKNANKTE